jgi:aldose sugar dehydrogenase
MKVKKNLRTFIKCVCSKCPSHNLCMKFKLEKVFCASGKSNCKVEEKGCKCPECPVAKEFNLTKTYYCK